MTYECWCAAPPPLTLDDLIDLHFMLLADDVFLQVMRSSLPAPTAS